MAFNVFFLLYFGLRVSLAASPGSSTVGCENLKLQANMTPRPALPGQETPEVPMVDCTPAFWSWVIE